MRKNFKEFLGEEPLKIDDFNDKDNSVADDYRKHILKHHENSEHLGNNYYHLKHDNGNHTYYRHDDNNVKEFSHITSKNVHVMTHKGKNGDSTHIKHFMVHHAKKYGSLISDNMQTRGGYKLWKDISKEKHKNIKIYHANLNDNTVTSANNKYLSDNENLINSKNNDSKQHILVMRHENET